MGPNWTGQDLRGGDRDNGSGKGEAKKRGYERATLSEAEDFVNGHYGSASGPIVRTGGWLAGLEG